MKRVLTDDQLLEIVRELAAAQSSPEQIAERLGRRPAWVRRRLGAEIDAYAQRGRDALRRAQFRLLARADPALLQWLGRQYAAQRPLPDVRDGDRIILIRRIGRPEPPARRVASRVKESLDHEGCEGPAPT